MKKNKKESDVSNRISGRLREYTYRRRSRGKEEK